MDLISFRSLYDSCERLEARTQVDFAWMNFVSGQCDSKAISEWQKHRYGSILSPPKKGLDDFVAKFGKGI